MTICKSLAEVEAIKKNNPFLYLVAFFADGRPASMIMGSKEKLVLWKVYGTICELQKDPKLSIQIFNVVDLNV